MYGNAQISEQREDNLLIDGFGGLYLVKPPFCVNAVPSLITDAATPKMRRVLATSCTILEMEVSDPRGSSPFKPFGSSFERS